MLLCEHLLFDHYRQGHEPSSLTHENKLNEVLGMIHDKKNEVLRFSACVISDVEELTFRKLGELEKLRKTAMDYYDASPSRVDQIRKEISKIQPHRLLMELNSVKQIIKSYEDQKREFKDKIIALTNQLNRVLGC